MSRNLTHSLHNLIFRLLTCQNLGFFIIWRNFCQNLAKNMVFSKRKKETSLVYKYVRRRLNCLKTVVCLEPVRDRQKIGFFGADVEIPVASFSSEKLQIRKNWSAPPDPHSRLYCFCRQRSEFGIIYGSSETASNQINLGG